MNFKRLEKMLIFRSAELSHSKNYLYSDLILTLYNEGHSEEKSTPVANSHQSTIWVSDTIIDRKNRKVIRLRDHFTLEMPFVSFLPDEDSFYYFDFSDTWGTEFDFEDVHVFKAPLSALETGSNLNSQGFTCSSRSIKLSPDGKGIAWVSSPKDYVVCYANRRYLGLKGFWESFRLYVNNWNKPSKTYEELYAELKQIDNHIKEERAVILYKDRDPTVIMIGHNDKLSWVDNEHITYGSENNHYLKNLVTGETTKIESFPGDWAAYCFTQNGNMVFNVAMNLTPPKSIDPEYGMDDGEFITPHLRYYVYNIEKGTFSWFKYDEDKMDYLISLSDDYVICVKYIDTVQEPCVSEFRKYDRNSFELLNSFRIEGMEHGGFYQKFEPIKEEHVVTISIPDLENFREEKILKLRIFGEDNSGEIEVLDTFFEQG